MKADFDKAAPNYDATFTQSVIGKLQRDLVYRQLSHTLKDGSQKDILEINCGTGEDAHWLASRLHKVTATDISQEMIAIARSKPQAANLVFEQADINSISEIYQGKKFDFVFSNFGGLNCLSHSQLENFFTKSAAILAPDAALFLVIMPKNTVWESVYFLLKGNFTAAFRRRKNNIQANVDGEKVNTFYYNPKDIVHLSEAKFRTKRISPVGFFVPPSYLEPFFKDRTKFTRILNALEQRISGQSWLSRFADHYIIVLQKR